MSKTILFLCTGNYYRSRFAEIVFPAKAPAAGNVCPMSDRQIALITGASAGIGKDLATVFAEHGFDMVINARNADALEQLARELRGRFKIDVRVLPKDLSQPSAPRDIVDQ